MEKSRFFRHYLVAALTALPLLLTAPQKLLAERELLVEAVVASVDGQPITLSEVGDRLNPPRRITLREAANDPEARLALDNVIQERIIEEEARQQRVSVEPGEVDEYLNEVALRNSLSLADLKRAVKDEGRSFEAYKETVRIEILKTKLISRFARSGVGVTSEEVENYIAEHPHLSKSGAKVKLSQIMLAKSGSQPDDNVQVKKKLAELKEEIQSGASFSETAKAYSVSPEGKDGGDLGVIAEEDLSPVIFDAIFALKEGELSSVVESSAGYHLFKVEERYVEDSGTSSELISEVKSLLERQKLELKVASYLATDLVKNHTVDKKI